MANDIKKGAWVNTLEGRGRVTRVSKMQAAAHVRVGDQEFEIPLSDLQVLEEQPPEGATPDGYEALMVPVKPDEVVHEFVMSQSPATTETASIEQEIMQQGHKPADADLFSQEYGGDWKPSEQGEAMPPQELPEQKVDKDKPEFPDALADLVSSIEKKVVDKIDGTVAKEFKELKELAKKNQKLEVKVGDKTNTIEGLRHKQLDVLITMAGLRLHVLMVGMAGTGKTHAGEQVAEALGLPFYAMSVGAQTAKSDIIGYMSANGDYVTTHFREAYEKGGVFLMDEIDAGNSNVLIQVNSALSNGLSAFPDKMIKKHKDFVFIATANTYGTGANRQYVGRNQLDAATLDRFSILDWEIDLELEANLASGKYAKEWYITVRAVRDYVQQHNIRALVTPRAVQKGSLLLDSGVDIESTITATLVGSVPQDKQPQVREVARRVFSDSQQADLQIAPPQEKPKRKRAVKKK